MPGRTLEILSCNTLEIILLAKVDKLTGLISVRCPTFYFFGNKIKLAWVMYLGSCYPKKKALTFLVTSSLIISQQNWKNILERPLGPLVLSPSSSNTTWFTSSKLGVLSISLCSSDVIYKQTCQWYYDFIINFNHLDLFRSIKWL